MVGSQGRAHGGIPAERHHANEVVRATGSESLKDAFNHIQARNVVAPLAQIQRTHGAGDVESHHHRQCVRRAHLPRELRPGVRRADDQARHTQQNQIRQKPAGALTPRGARASKRRCRRGEEDALRFRRPEHPPRRHAQRQQEQEHPGICPHRHARAILTPVSREPLPRRGRAASTPDRRGLRGSPG